MLFCSPFVPLIIVGKEISPRCEQSRCGNGKEIHRNRGGLPGILKAVREAFKIYGLSRDAQVLSDEQKRKAYDQSGFSEFSGPEGAYGVCVCVCVCVCMYLSV